MAQYYLAFWNLENLFAPEGFAGREPWIAKAVGPDLRGWTDTLFSRKISQLTRVITAMNNGAGPDLLGVCEVENRFCLERLAASLNTALPQRDYQLVHVDATRDHRGIDTAFLFDARRLGTNPAEVFSHWVMRRTGTRDITQATFITEGGQEFIALANHWPSRSGRAVESAGYRSVAGETLAYWHERIREVKGPNVPIIAFGDFNDDPWDASLIYHARGTRERIDVVNAQSAKFYNLSWRHLNFEAQTHKGGRRQLNGTLYYGGNGNFFDQILLSRGFLLSGAPLRALETEAGVFALPAMVDHRTSRGPIRFGLPDGNAAKNIN